MSMIDQMNQEKLESNKNIQDGSKEIASNKKVTN